MQALYKQENLKEIQGQIKRRSWILAMVAAALAGGIIYSFIPRIEWLSVALVIVLGMVLIFCIEMLIRPLFAYKRLLQAALGGRSHEDELVYSETEPDVSMVDGINCRTLIFLGEPDKHGTRDRRYYWDATLSVPEFETGARVRLKYTDKMIIGYELL